MTKNEKTALYVVGGLAVIGAGVAIYFAATTDKKVAAKSAPTPQIPVSDVTSVTPPPSDEIPQAEILQQQQQQQQQPPPPPPPPQILILPNLSQL